MCIRNQSDDSRPGVLRHASYITCDMSWSRLVMKLAARSIARPALALDLIRVGWRFRSRGWYTRFPFLPIPDRSYLRWRMYTAYGDYDAIPPAEDVERRRDNHDPDFV